MRQASEHVPPFEGRQARAPGAHAGTKTRTQRNSRVRTNYGSSIAVLGGAALGMTVLLASCGDSHTMPSESGGGGQLAFVAPPTTLLLGNSVPLTVTATPVGGTATPVVPSWSSSNGQVAAVSDAGVLYAISDGTASITAAYNGLNATIDVSVAGSGSFPSTAEVDMPAETYAPSELDVAVGAVVSFHFPAEQHNVVFSGSAPGAPASIAPTMNTVVNSRFTTRGLFPYICTIHPGMAGTVIVH